MNQYAKYKWVVRWETLNGNVQSKRFTNATDASDFYERKTQTASIYGTQWVDIDQTSS